MTDPRLDLVDFAVQLRDKGIPVDPARVVRAAAALAALRPASPEALYWATRLTLCSRADQIAVFTRVFLEFFGAAPEFSSLQDHASRDEQGGAGDSGSAEGDAAVVPHQPAGSWAERVAPENPGVGPEGDSYDAIAEAIALALPPRRSARRQRGGHREIDLRRTARVLGRTGGEVVQLHHRRPTRREQRVLILIDVSKSMVDVNAIEPMLRLAHALVRRRPGVTAVFTLGSRATHITGLLAEPDASAAVRAVWEGVSDRGGGTRLGQALYHLLRSWGGRALTRSAITILVSDGYVADLEILDRQMPRLARRSRRLISLNAGVPTGRGYKPAGQALVKPRARYFATFIGGRDGAAMHELVAAMLAH